MKKFVVVDSWGTWERVNGKRIIDCTVKGHDKLAESNTYTDLHLPERLVEYHEDGTWHSFSIEKRTRAKAMGLA